MTKLISLTQGKSAIVDDKDYEWLNQWKWRTLVGYAARYSNGSHESRELILMHRLISNTPKGMDTDHINGNRLDNRRSNLRICSRLQNNCNSKLRITNKSGFRGVFYRKSRNKFEASVKVKGKGIYLGYYNNPKDAACAYDRVAVQVFGEFARLNFPNEMTQSQEE